MFFGFHKSALNVYFRAFYLGTSMVLILGIAILILEKPFKVSEIRSQAIKSILSYGTYNEFNYLIQFLNYRLSYYFIAKMAGLAELGVFSVVVSISEAVWIISRSMSAIHFSNVINSDDQQKSRRETIVFARQSFIVSLLVLSIVVLIPRSLYQLIFGNEFGDVKKFIILLLPGIIAIAVSNLFGHYFSGRGKLKILRNKSIIGLIATIAFLPILLYKYQLTGVCISLNISYLLSSLYLWFIFHKEGQMAGR
jgi:O-antigen/teichoic acid export membrane protein